MVIQTLQQAPSVLWQCSYRTYCTSKVSLETTKSHCQC